MNTIIPATLLLLLVSLTEIHGEFIKMCYYSAWAAYRDGDQALKPEDVDAHHCTHLALAYGTIDDSGKRVKFPDVFEDMHLPERMNSLRDHNEDLNMVLSVGGWMMDSEAWSNMLMSKENMEEFAKEAIVFLRFHDFDGIDLDWQYPAFRKSTAEDRERFADFMEIMRHAIETEHEPDSKWSLSLSLSVDPSAYRVINSYNLKRMAREVDFFNLKTYDLHGHWDEPMAAVHHSPLTHADSPININTLARSWAEAGVPKNMLVLGIPYYGRSFRLQNPNMTMPGAPALGPGSDGGEGIPVNKICHLIRGGVQEQYIPEQKVPYYVMGDEWVGFDNLRSVREKAMLVASNHLGGVALWTLDQDDHRGVCGEKWSITFEVIHGLGRAEYVDYVAAKQESLRELINHKIVHTSKEIGYYSDVQNSTMAARKEAELAQLQNDLATLQDQQQKQWMQVQRAATLGGKALPPLDQPSWKL